MSPPRARYRRIAASACGHAERKVVTGGRRRPRTGPAPARLIVVRCRRRRRGRAAAGPPAARPGRGPRPRAGPPTVRSCATGRPRSIGRAAAASGQPVLARARRARRRRRRHPAGVSPGPRPSRPSAGVASPPASAATAVARRSTSRPYDDGRLGRDDVGQPPARGAQAPPRRAAASGPTTGPVARVPAARDRSARRPSHGSPAASVGQPRHADGDRQPYGAGSEQRDHARVGSLAGA